MDVVLHRNKTRIKSDINDDCQPPRGCVTKDSELGKELKYKKNFVRKEITLEAVVQEPCLNDTTPPSCCKLATRHREHIIYIYNI